MVAMFCPIEGRRVVRNLRSVMNSSDQRKIRTLKKKKEIVQILKNGHRIRTRYGTFYLVRGDHNERKMAVLIQKQVGNSVQRNYRKRIVREYIRNHFGNIHSFNVAIFLYNFSGSISYHQLKSEFSRRIETL
jgi:ribonuclease P protein component